MFLPKQRSNIVLFSSLLIVGNLFLQCAGQEPSVNALIERSKVLWNRTDDLFRIPYDNFGADRSYEHADGVVFPYRLFEPKMEDGKLLPLVVFFHGGGGEGTDNQQQFTDLILAPTVWALPEHQEKNPAYVLVPQAAKWTGWLHPNLPAMKGLIDTVISLHSIDPDRIYITGLSMGGLATWAMIQEYPDFFAAAVPVCGGGDLNELDGIMNSNLPIWAFHGVLDPVIKIDTLQDWFDKPEEVFSGQRTFINELTRRGMEPTPKGTWYPDMEHNAWDGAYSDPELFNWLFSQSKQQRKQR